MAHVSQEFRLGAACRLRLFLGIPQLGFRYDFTTEIAARSPIAEESAIAVEDRIAVDADVLHVATFIQKLVAEITERLPGQQVPPGTDPRLNRGIGVGQLPASFSDNRGRIVV